MKIRPMMLIISAPLTIVASLTRYLFQDWEFAKWIALAVILDTILSVILERSGVYYIIII